MINNSYIEQINKAILLEETAKGIQGKVLDGGKLVSVIETIHKGVSDKYKIWYGEVISELITTSRKFERFIKETYGKDVVNLKELESSWNKTNFQNARTAMSMLNKTLEVYNFWNKEVTGIMKKNIPYECFDEITEQIKIMSNRLYNTYEIFMDIPTPKKAIADEYNKIQEELENKYK